MSPFPSLFAQMSQPVPSAEEGTQLVQFLFNPAVVWVLIPIVGIIVGTVATIIHRSQQHRERMAMIAAGMHPDYPPEAEMDEGGDPLRETAAYRSA